MKIKCKPWRGSFNFKWAHLKLDGIYIEVKNGRAYTSTPIDITSQLPPLGVPSGWHTAGELWVPGQPASYVKSVIANGDLGLLKYSPFALLHLPPETPLPTLERLCEDHGLHFPRYEHCHEDIDWPTDGEGWVFKNGNVLDWEKLKPVLTIDLIVTDVKPGKGKFVGQVGALVCSTAEGHTVANVSGMDDDERRRMSRSDIGRIVEVAYQYVGAGGRLRHPRFVGWRDDKTAVECGASQDPELEKYYAS